MAGRVDDFSGLRGLALVVALTEATKRVFPALKPRWFVAVAMWWALVLNLLIAYYLDANLIPALIEGITCGLAAVGLYSASKNVLGPDKGRESANGGPGSAPGMQNGARRVPTG